MVFLYKRAVAIDLYLYDFIVLLISWRMTRGSFSVAERDSLAMLAV